MGQYYVIANTDRHEYISPWDAGSGAKLWEICMNDVSRVLPYLLAQGANGSGGDPRLPWGEFERTDGSVDWDAYHEALDAAYPNLGRWAGDRITVVGDYDESGLYAHVRESYTEISDDVREELREFLGEDVHLGGERDREVRA